MYQVTFSFVHSAQHLNFILNKCVFKCNRNFILQIGRSRNLFIDIVLAHPTIKKFVEPVEAEIIPAHVPTSTGRNCNSIGTVLRDSLENVQQKSFVSDRISRFAARIVIEKKTQIASIYAGTMDSNLEISLGVIRMALN